MTKPHEMAAETIVGDAPTKTKHKPKAKAEKMELVKPVSQAVATPPPLAAPAPGGAAGAPAMQQAPPPAAVSAPTPIVPQHEAALPLYAAPPQQLEQKKQPLGEALQGAQLG